MVYYYLITTILVAVSLGIVVFSFALKKVNYYIFVLLLFMTLANTGYLAIALSGDLSEAILANKICYLGGCFTPTINLCFICALCNYRVTPWQRAGMYTYSAFVYLMVLMIGYNDFYYAETSLESYGGATVLAHTYGPGHVFFQILLYGFTGIQVLLLVYSVVKKRAVSQKNLHLLIICMVMNVGLFTVGRCLNPAFEIMPLVYVFDSWVILSMYRRGLAYNLEDNIMLTFGKKENSGYIMFDNSLNYLGCNYRAAVIFPELADCMIDRPIYEITEIAHLIDWISDYRKDGANGFPYERDGLHYEGQVEKLWYRKKENGYMVELREDTDQWKYTQLLAEHNAQLEGFQQELERTVSEQTKELRNQQQKMQELFVQTVTALSEAVDAKDRYTSGHSKRVAAYARMLAARMGKSREEQEDIYRAGLLHDVGKIRIPAEIISKPGKLTDEEYDTIKLHPVTGYQILKQISDDRELALAARYHHERYDGRGYPNGLAGMNIPESARILGVADAYDAMASNRSYRKALPQEVVRAEIEKGRGTQFDPKIADIMLQMIDEDVDYKLKQTENGSWKILTVAEDAVNQALFADIAQEEPRYQMVAAGSGEEALEILEQQKFDLILLDVDLADTDGDKENGLELLELIHEKYQTAVVLMTNNKSRELLQAYEEFGCGEYITKPFLPLLVKEIIYIMTERSNVK